MASSIYTSLILFSLLHIGMAYNIWYPRSEQEATLDATLDIFKSVNKNPETSDTDEEFKLLASKLLSFFNQVGGIELYSDDLHSGLYLLATSGMINIIVSRSNDSKLQEAEREINKIHRLFTTEYTWFLNNETFPNETQAMIREALELDNESSFESSEAMSNIYKIYIEKYQGLKSYHDVIGSSARFLHELAIYNIQNDWNAFMMMTTAYKLRSLESNDIDYVKEFQRLRKQLMNKIVMHNAKYLNTLESFVHMKHKLLMHDVKSLKALRLSLQELREKFSS